MIHAERVSVGLYADSHPNVVGPLQLLGHLCKPLRSLRQYLIGVLRSLGHDGEDAADELERYRRVEQVAHAVDEDHSALSPSPRDLEGVLVEGEPEPEPAGSRVTVYLVLGGSHRLEALGESEGVAVVTAWRRLVAAGGRIPGRLGPFD